jgi:hypothetical protein
MVYTALLPLMHTPRLPAVDWTDAPADLNGLVRFGERRNLVSARVPSHFKRSLPLANFHNNCSFTCVVIFRNDWCLSVHRSPNIRLPHSVRVLVPFRVPDFDLWSRTLATSLQEYFQLYTVYTACWVPGTFLGVKAAGAWGWQPYHLNVPNVMKSRSLNLLEPSGPHQACYGTALPYTACVIKTQVS